MSYAIFEGIAGSHRYHSSLQDIPEGSVARLMVPINFSHGLSCNSFKGCIEFDFPVSSI